MKCRSRKKMFLAENVCFSAGYHKAEYISAGAVKRSKWRGFPLWKMQVEALYAASDYVLSAFRELLEEEEEAYNNTINKRWCLYEHEK